MRTRPLGRAVPLVLSLALVTLAGCGSGDGGPTTTAPARVEVVHDLAPGADADGRGRPGADIDARRIFARLGGGVVTVLTQGAGGGSSPSSSGLGSGFVISGSGLIVTNAHVVTSGDGPKLKPAHEVYVRFGDRNQVRARVVGVDPFSDVALLKVDPAGLKLVPLRFAGPHDARVGDPVVAIGSPFGEEQSLSIGVVSALERSIRSLTGFDTVDAVQTDAAINRGNSGGPLLDARGRVVGVNSQIETTSGDGSGVGFAISSATAQHSIAQLRKAGHVAYAYIGVSTVEVYPQLARRFDLGVDHGAWVQRLPSGSPADKAGVKGPDGGAKRFQVGEYRPGGDVIVGVGDQAVRSSTDLAEATQRLRPGQRVTVHVFRDGKRRDVRVTLGKRPAVAPKA